MHIVGPKGQIVINGEIRQRLRIAPGWRATQSLDGDPLQICFVPPNHSRSFFGALSVYAKGQAPADEASIAAEADKP
jgi:bifunctional DNA-binding transcriptional regulator/antitoxin component of YhaV-PrlF toxin-antitoxin module